MQRHFKSTCTVCPFIMKTATICLVTHSKNSLTRWVQFSEYSYVTNQISVIPIPRGFWLFSKMSQIWFILKMTNTLPATSYRSNAFWVHSYIKIKMMVYTSAKYAWLLRVLNAISLQYNESSTFFVNAFLCVLDSYCCYQPFLNFTRSFEIICIFDK